MAAAMMGSVSHAGRGNDLLAAGEPISILGTEAITAHKRVAGVGRVMVGIAKENTGRKIALRVRRVSGLIARRVVHGRPDFVQVKHFVSGLRNQRDG